MAPKKKGSGKGGSGPNFYKDADGKIYKPETITKMFEDEGWLPKQKEIDGEKGCQWKLVFQYTYKEPREHEVKSGTKTKVIDMEKSRVNTTPKLADDVWAAMSVRP